MNRPDDTIRVLHVDNAPNFAETIGLYLERENDRFEVAPVMSASEGLRRLDEEHFDCVISDYQMPKIDGIEFLETVRERSPGLPFIVFTARGSEEVASKAISAGATDYLQKGIGTGRYDLLANRITNAVSQYRAKQQVLETERKLRELTEVTNDVFFMDTADFSERLFINSAYEEIWGQSIDAVMAEPRDFLNGIHPDDRERVKAAMQKVSNGESVEVEYRVNPEEDYERWVWAQGEPIYDEDGDVIRVAGFAREITGRKQREKELKAARERIEFALKATNAVMWDVDTETEEVIHHPSSRTLFDTNIDTVDEFLAQVHPEDRQQVKAAFERGHKTGQFRIEFRITGGGIRWLESVGRIETNAEGAPTRAIGFAQDITDRKKREQELQRLRSD